MRGFSVLVDKSRADLSVVTAVLAILAASNSNMFRNPFSFKGRIRRTEYVLSLIIYLMGAFLLFMMIFGLSQLSVWFLGMIPFALFTAIWFQLAQAAKRSHDIGNSGWLILIPFYTWLLLFINSQSGENKYGPNPKNIGNNAPEMDEIGLS